MSLTGVEALVRRLDAIQRAPLFIGRRWAQETTKAAQTRIPVRTGATRASVHPGPSSSRNATVLVSYIANFIDAGSKAHDETPKNAKTLRFTSGGQTFFAKKVSKPRIAPRPFKRAAATEGLRRANGADEIVRLWNGAG